MVKSNDMANTYKKVYIHLVFAVKNRNSLLEKEWRSSVFRYISGIVSERGHYSLSVGGYNDHVHILFDYNLKELIPDLVREIKKASTKFIKEQGLSKYKFEWQSGYGVFSVGWREKENLIEYFRNQDEHHGIRSFRQEYLSLLQKFEIEFKDEYVFKFFNEGLNDLCSQKQLLINKISKW